MLHGIAPEVTLRSLRAARTARFLGLRGGEKRCRFAVFGRRYVHCMNSHGLRLAISLQ